MKKSKYPYPPYGGLKDQVRPFNAKLFAGMRDWPEILRKIQERKELEG